MYLLDPELLSDALRTRERSGGWLAGKAGVTRQFIHLMLHGQRRTCAPEVAQAIESALEFERGSLFTEHDPLAERAGSNSA